MMRVYEAPEIELIRFQTEDVLDTSYTLNEDDETTPIFKKPF